MAVVNRYTQRTPARYNARSFEEMMVAPAYMREQHDNITIGMGELESAIAKVDPLALHSEEARMEQQRLYDSITQQAEVLNAEGFNPSAKSQFMKLNKDYQQSTGPTGKLGKIQSAKEILEKNKQAFLAGSIEAGYDPRSMQQNWEDFEKLYAAQYEETGKITPIGEMYPPEYFDYIKEGKELFKEAGITGTDIMTGNGAIVFDEEKGGYVVNTTHQSFSQGNAEQLEKAATWLTNNIMNPNSAAGQSIRFQRKTPEQAIQELAGLSDVYKKETSGSKDVSTIGGWKPDAGNAVTKGGMGLIMSGEQSAAAKFSDTPLTEARGMALDLAAKKAEKGLTKEEEQDLYELDRYTERVNSQLEMNPEYSEFNTALADKEQQLQDKINNEYNWEQDGMYSAQKDSLMALVGTGEMSRMAAEEQLTKIKQTSMDSDRNTIGTFREELDKIAEGTAQTIQQQMTSYTVNPQTNVQNTSYKLMNQTFDRIIKSNPANIQAMMDIQEVRLDGAAYSDLTQDDRDGIMELIQNTKRNSTTIEAITPNDFQDKPGYLIRIDTEEKEGQSYDMDGLGKGNIGGGKPVYVRVNFTADADESTGIANVNGMALNYVRSTGPMGAQLVDNIEQTQATRRYRGKSYADLDAMGAIENDPTVQQMYLGELAKLGITKDSSEEEVELAAEKLANKQISPLTVF